MESFVINIGVIMFYINIWISQAAKCYYLISMNFQTKVFLTKYSFFIYWRSYIRFLLVNCWLFYSFHLLLKIVFGFCCWQKRLVKQKRQSLWRSLFLVYFWRSKACNFTKSQSPSGFLEGRWPQVQNTYFEGQILVAASIINKFKNEFFT